VALFVGSEAEGTGSTAGTSIAIEKAEAFKFVAVKTGTVETIKFRTGSGVQAATSVVAAIAPDVAGKPGTVVLGDEATLTVTVSTNTTYEVTGLSAAVTSGSTYWLMLLPLGGVIRIRTHKVGEAGSTASVISSTPTRVKKATEVITWGAEELLGPLFLAGVGPESGGTKVQAVSGALSFAGTLPSATTHQLPAGLTFAGMLQRRTVRRLGGTLSFLGSLSRITTRQLPASLSFAGMLQRNTSRSLAAGLSLAGALPRNSVQGLTASLSFAGQLPRVTRHQLAAALSFLGKLTPQEVGKVVYRIEAALSFEGRLGRKTARQLPAGLNFQGAIQRSTAKQLAAGLSFAGVLRRATQHRLNASLSFAGTLARTVRMPFAASLSFAGRLAFKGAKALGLPGRVSPFQRLGRGSPSSRSGMSNPSQDRGEG